MTKRRLAKIELNFLGCKDGTAQNRTEKKKKLIP